MIQVLDYAPSAAPSPWPRRCRLAFASCLVAAVPVVVACAVSTGTMRFLQSRVGRTVLQGPPNGKYYEMWVAAIPFLLGTGLIAAAWSWTVWRSGRGDRLAVACMTAVLHGCLWLVLLYQIAYNGEIAFP